ncbi:hypothetical protein IIC45_00995 [Patescibacteria group bacterium]|nr:hypothetical protein [Patescibacteria group bacterium]
MKQLVQESKSLRRIKNNYKGDAPDCADCSAFWTKMEKDKEDHVKELTALVKKHLA